mmetsp:Transcript_25322/g.68555  ORF Transcript_25322/g.68555 Transcript_25322/m.68555 type:complete len:209 (-) Transcript_25322:602-1228(-)
MTPRARPRAKIRREALLALSHYCALKFTSHRLCSAQVQDRLCSAHAGCASHRRRSGADCAPPHTRAASVSRALTGRSVTHDASSAQGRRQELQDWGGSRVLQGARHPQAASRMGPHLAAAAAAAACRLGIAHTTPHTCARTLHAQPDPPSQPPLLLLGRRLPVPSRRRQQARLRARPLPPPARLLSPPPPSLPSPPLPFASSASRQRT